MENNNHEERLKIDAINGFKHAKTIMNVSKVSLSFLSGTLAILGIVSAIECIKSKELNNHVMTLVLTIISFLISEYLGKKAIVCHNHSVECEEMIEQISIELSELEEENRKGK